jgi:2Fe-2S ferredoxin
MSCLFQEVFLSIHLVVVDHRGEEHVLEALEGWRVSEIVRDWGLRIKAECGGACACATCHVYIEREWLDRLVAPNSEEIDMLDGALVVESNSRLACQILMREDLDGLRLRLAPGSEVD